jgi:DNA-binding LacI/PurR family transcriptional regulator
MDAVFVSNDQMALGVLKAAHESGRRVPGDLAVVGFDNIPESLYFWPTLTTVNQPLIDLGGRAVETLSQLIKAEETESIKSDDTQTRGALPVLLKPELIVRNSSGRSASG